MKRIVLLNFCLFYFFYNFSNTNAASSCGLYRPNQFELNGNCSYGYTGSYCDECGLSFYDPNVRIVGGKEAVPYSWPSMALIVFRYKFYFRIDGNTYLSSTSSYCGGSLISRDKVLTAAHCFNRQVSVLYGGRIYTVDVTKNSFYPTYESMYTVYLGLHDKTSAVNDLTIYLPGVAKKIHSFNFHSSYNSNNNLNDIAIIKLASNVDLSCYIQPACLPNPSFLNYPIPTNIDTWAAGWGTLSSGGTSPNRLYNVMLTLYSSSYCNKVYPSIEKDWNKQICAGEYEGGKDTCQGDSGGPLFVLDFVNGVRKYIVVGITSYGYKCAQYESPGIYTKVSSYLKWIDNYQKESISSLYYDPNNSNYNSAIHLSMNFILVSLLLSLIFKINN